MIKKINYFFQAILIYFLFLIGLILGLKLSRIFFSTLFSYFGPFFKSRIVINKNLNIFIPNIPNDKKNKIINNMWKNYGKTFIEYIFLKKLKNQEQLIEIINENNLIDIIKKDQPVIFISGHFANFELMSMTIVNKNIKLATIYRPLNNFFLNFFMEFLRKKYVCKNQIKKGINGVRQAIQYIKQGHSIALMIDQRVSEGEKINFFGKTAFTTTLPAQLAQKFNLKIVPVFLERTQDDKFRISFYKEIDPNNYKNKLDISIKLNQIIESMISKNPNQWIWTHNRWK